MKKYIIIIIILLLPLPVIGQVEHAFNSRLAGKQSAAIGTGIKWTSNVVAQTLDVIVEDNNPVFSGGIEYGYWFKNDFQLALNIDILETNTNDSRSGAKIKSVLSLAAGFKYYPENLRLGNAGRFFFGFLAGPVVCSAVDTDIDLTRKIVETKFGAKLTAGTDFFIGSWMKMGFNVNYYFMTRFTEIGRGISNFNGFSLGINAGIVF